MINNPTPNAADAVRRDYDALLRRTERLMEISSVLASTLDLARLLRQILDAARELTEAEAGSILLLEPSTGELRFEATTNLRPNEMAGVMVPLEGSIAGWVVQHNQPLLVPDTRTDPRWDAQVDQMTAFATRSILCVPLVAQEQTVGVLEAVNKRQGTFTADDMQTLQWLAAQAAVAIVNARLFQQSDLVAEMIHELRTPLSSLMAASQLLLRPELSEGQQRDLVEVLERETRRLAQMTTDFLDMARLESGRVQFTLAAFDLAALLEECLGLVQPQADQRGVALTSEVGLGLPPVESDRDKVKQVLLNLLTNAIKYNRENGKVHLRAQGAPGLVRVYVDDTGPGLAPEALKRIFDRFYRSPAHEHSHEGTGLGLPIARRIIEALGGELGVQSTPGQGSTFYFSLPPKPRKTNPLGR
jgi:signal transduction histidine kinase